MGGLGGFLIRDATAADRGAVLDFWPHPDRFDRRLASSAAGDEALLVAESGSGAGLGCGSGSGARSESWSGSAVGTECAVRAGSAVGAECAVGAGCAVAGVASLRWSGGCDDPNRPLLYALEVRPELRGRGAGTALIRSCAGRAAGRGFAEITLEVEVGNAGAIRLYRRLGFVTVGPHRHIWHAGKVTGGTDVLIMRGRSGQIAAG
ncbi:GNAT family N-acetyltransferase [Actinoplanes sp. G11-F43]|uniref:GNAT family N-acetyltransferase n=1 Tax=Actinoplanes sp. G11-F43 TaxID=3424130 RepID=UPI003D32C669